MGFSPSSRHHSSAATYVRGRSHAPLRSVRRFSQPLDGFFRARARGLVPSRCHVQGSLSVQGLLSRRSLHFLFGSSFLHAVAASPLVEHAPTFAGSCSRPRTMPLDFEAFIHAWPRSSGPVIHLARSRSPHRVSCSSRSSLTRRGPTARLVSRAPARSRALSCVSRLRASSSGLLGADAFRAKSGVRRTSALVVTRSTFARVAHLAMSPACARRPDPAQSYRHPVKTRFTFGDERRRLRRRSSHPGRSSSRAVLACFTASAPDSRLRSPAALSCLALDFRRARRTITGDLVSSAAPRIRLAPAFAGSTRLRSLRRSSLSRRTGVTCASASFHPRGWAMRMRFRLPRSSRSAFTRRSLGLARRFHLAVLTSRARPLASDLGLLQGQSLGGLVRMSVQWLDPRSPCDELDPAPGIGPGVDRSIEPLSAPAFRLASARRSLPARLLRARLRLAASPFALAFHPAFPQEIRVRSCDHLSATAPAHQAYCPPGQFSRHKHPYPFGQVHLPRANCPFGQVSPLRCAALRLAATRSHLAIALQVWEPAASTARLLGSHRGRLSFRPPTSEAFACGSRARATALVRLQRIAIEQARSFRLRSNRPARAFEPTSRGSDPRSARALRLSPSRPRFPLHGAALAFPTFAFAPRRTLALRSPAVAVAHVALRLRGIASRHFAARSALRSRGSRTRTTLAARTRSARAARIRTTVEARTRSARAARIRTPFAEHTRSACAAFRASCAAGLRTTCAARTPATCGRPPHHFHGADTPACDLHLPTRVERSHRFARLLLRLRSAFAVRCLRWFAVVRGSAAFTASSRDSPRPQLLARNVLLSQPLRAIHPFRSSSPATRSVGDRSRATRCFRSPSRVTVAFAADRLRNAPLSRFIAYATLRFRGSSLACAPLSRLATLTARPS